MLKGNYVEGFLAETMVWEGGVPAGTFGHSTDSLVKLVQLTTVLGKQKNLCRELDWLHNPPLAKLHQDTLQTVFELIQVDRVEVFKSFLGFDLHPAVQVANLYLNLFGQSIISMFLKKPENMTQVDLAIVNAFVLEVRHSLNCASLQLVRKRFIATAASRLREVIGYATRLQSNHGGLVVFNLIVREPNKNIPVNPNFDPEKFALQIRKGLVKTFKDNLVGFIWKYMDLPGKPAIFDSLIFLPAAEIAASHEELIANLNVETSLAGSFFATPPLNQSGIMFPLVLNENSTQSRELLKAVITQKFSDGYFFQKTTSGKRKIHGYGIKI